MKKILVLFVLSALYMSCTEPAPKLAPGEYKIIVKAPGIYNGIRGYIGELNRRRNFVAIDTAMVVNEQLEFGGFVEEVSFQELSINGVEGTLKLILEPGIMNITVNKDNILESEVKGGINNQDYTNYNKELAKRSTDIREYQKELSQARNAQNSDKVKKLTADYKAKTILANNYYGEFIANNPNSDFSLLLLETKLTPNNENVTLVKNSYEALSDVIEKNPKNKAIGKKIENFIKEKEALENVAIGKVAPNFSGPTPDGKTLALSDIKGKATIIDFWAAWCGPCRRENPNVVRVYEKYKDKGLEIISVSLDRPNQKQRWTDAIEKDNLNWHHISNLQYFKDPIARLYGVSSIPAMFVLDADGKIVAKKLRGKALENQIASMLN